MLWQEQKTAEEYVVPDTVVDAVFAISCRSLPVDHAYALSQAIQAALPWFADEEAAGLHTIHGAESGNGWMRPEDPQALLHLSQRTRLVLRLPRQRLAAAAVLLGQTLDVAGHPLRLDKLTLRPLSRLTTLFSRHMVIAAGVNENEDENEDESAFLQRVVEQLEVLGIRAAKMLCGRMTTIALPGRSLQTRSLMLADLAIEEAVLLQQRGLGAQRKLGCGLFIPHKDINEVRQKSE